MNDPASPAKQPPLRVYLITEDDPLYVARFFEVFFAQLPRDRIEVIGITVSRAFHESLLKTARRVHRFYGTVDFVRLFARWLPNRLFGKKIRDYARDAGVTVYDAQSVNSPEFVEFVKGLNPDMLVSVAAPEVFKGPLLSVPRIGCLNIHSGRLPRYRGMMPTFWQLRHGEKAAVVTVHEMVTKLDAGGVVRTLEFPLLERDILHRVMVGTKQQGARLMIDVLASIDPREGRMPPSTPLDMSQAGYFRYPDAENVKAYRGMGHRFL